MRTIVRSYEPFFGGIVAALAAALIGYVLFMPPSSKSHTGSAMMLWYGGTALSWGVLQIVGYRQAKKKRIQLEAPLMDMAISCVLLGLMFALAALCVFEVAHNKPYSTAMGTAAVVLLCVGAFIGIRRGTWRK